MKAKCDHCKQKFKNDSALAMHARAKHPVQVQRDAQRARKGTFGVFAASFCGTLLAMVVGGMAVLAVTASPEARSTVATTAADAKAALFKVSRPLSQGR